MMKIAVAIRASRAAIGWNQQEFADLLGIAKTTVARIETMEMKPSAAFLLEAMQLFKRCGIDISLLDAGLSITLSDQAISNAESLLLDETKRRSDRKRK